LSARAIKTNLKSALIWQPWKVD